MQQIEIMTSIDILNPLVAFANIIDISVVKEIDCNRPLVDFQEYFSSIGCEKALKSCSSSIKSE